MTEKTSPTPSEQFSQLADDLEFMADRELSAYEWDLLKRMCKQNGLEKVCNIFKNNFPKTKFLDHPVAYLREVVVKQKRSIKIQDAIENVGKRKRLKP